MSSNLERHKIEHIQLGLDDTVSGFDQHNRQHEIDSGADHAPAGVSNYGKFVRANPSNGAIEFATVDAVVDHGDLTGLSDDDHSQYHNDTRGDIRYYRKTEFTATSAGIADAGKPVILSASGVLDTTLLPGGALTDHGALGGLSDDDHTQYLLANGSRTLTGDLSVTALKTIDGRDISVDGSTLDTINTNYLKKDGSVALTAAWAANNRIYHSSAALNLGTSAATSHSLTTGDVLVGGVFESDGLANLDGGALAAAGTYFAWSDVGIRRAAAGILEVSDGGASNFGSLRIGTAPTTITSGGALQMGAALHSMADGSAMCFGNTGGGATHTNLWIDTSQAQISLNLGTATGRQFVFGDRAGYAQDYDHIAGTDPVVYVHSATAPDTNNTQWIGLFHDQAKGRITTGLGVINLGTASAGTRNLTTGDTVVGGMFEVVSSGIFDTAPSAPGSGSLSERWGAGALVGTGTNNLAIGAGATTATNNTNYNVAIGATASGISGNDYVTAIGASCNSQGTGGSNTVIGALATTTGAAGGVVVIGKSASASGSNSVTIGNAASNANTSESIAIGYSSAVTGDGAITIGARSGGAAGSISMGAGTSGTGARSFCIGEGGANGSTDAITLGYGAQSSANKGVAIGATSLTTTVDGSIAIGYGSWGDGAGVALGYQAIARGSSSIAIGPNATCGTFTNSVAIGDTATVAGNNKMVLGTVSQPLDVLSSGTATFKGNIRFMGRTTTAADPTTTEYPLDRDWGFHKNSNTGNLYLTYNDGGTTIKKVTLT